GLGGFRVGGFGGGGRRRFAGRFAGRRGGRGWRGGRSGTGATAGRGARLGRRTALQARQPAVQVDALVGLALVKLLDLVSKPVYLVAQLLDLGGQLHHAVLQFQVGLPGALVLRIELVFDQGDPFGQARALAKGGGGGRPGRHHREYANGVS